MSSYLGNSVVLGSAGTPVKRYNSHHINSWEFDALSGLAFPNVASIDAGVATSTIQARIVLPQACKIPKVALSCSAIDDILGNALFNIALGTAATYHGVPPNDNQEVLGYPTAYGANGQALFASDYPFTPNNFPGLTVANGGSGVAIPTNWDGIILAGTVLTLRVKTVASTGSMANLQCTLLIAYIDLLPGGRNNGTDGMPTGTDGNGATGLPG